MDPEGVIVHGSTAAGQLAFNLAYVGAVVPVGFLTNVTISR